MRGRASAVSLFIADSVAICRVCVNTSKIHITVSLAVNQQNCFTGVPHRVEKMSKESRKFQVPDALAHLYDFANSLDVRHFVHHGVQHPQSDELADPRELGVWMGKHGLPKANGKVTA